MKNNLINSTGYELCQFLRPSSLLASQTNRTMARAKKKRSMKPEKLTYRLLLEAQEKLIQFQELNGNTAANRASALRNFLRANAFVEDDVVGLEMRPHFPKSVERMCRALESEGMKSRGVTNAKSALQPWREAVARWDAQQAKDAELPTPFITLLKVSLRELPLNHVARETCIPKDMLRGWTKGKSPRASSAKYIRRLEIFFGIEKHSLLSLAGFAICAKEKAELPPPVQVDFRIRQRALVKVALYLQVPLDSPLRQQWKELVEYKTAIVPILERTGRGRWTFAPLAAKTNTPCNWFTFHNGREVPAAYAVGSHVLSYLGFLGLSKKNGGVGLPVESLQSIAWLVVPDYIQAYIEWQRDRSGGILSRRAIQFIAALSCLVRPIYGYLSQNQSLQKTLPLAYHGQDWTSLCNKQFAFLAKMEAAYRSEAVPSRDSFAPIRHILDLPQPMEAIADMIQRMRADRPIGSESQEAVWARDIFLVKLMVSNPLRLRNIACLEWSPEYVNGKYEEGKCCLYQRTNGSWWIHIAKRLLKNRGGAQIKDYDSPIHSSLWVDLERYLFTYRSKLVRSPTNYVLLARQCAQPASVNPVDSIVEDKEQLKPREHKPFMELSGRLEFLTKRYLWGCDGIHAHAFRHIVATAILKSPGGDIKTAALVLHDAEITVTKHYSGMLSADGANRMAELLGKSFARM